MDLAIAQNAKVRFVGTEHIARSCKDGSYPVQVLGVNTRRERLESDSSSVGNSPERMAPFVELQPVRINVPRPQRDARRVCRDTELVNVPDQSCHVLSLASSRAGRGELHP
jgi:hypothetical protein